MSANRMDRVNAYIMELLGQAIRRVKDPRLSPLAAVTEVRTAKDLSMAKVFVSFDGTRAEREETLAALTAARGWLKREIGQQLTMKKVPDLVFLLDDTIERGARVIAKLSQIARERGDDPADPASARPPADEPPRD